MKTSSFCFELYQIDETEEEPRDVWDRMFLEDEFPNKVKLVGGRDRKGKPHVLSCVQQAEHLLKQSTTNIPWLNEYLIQKEELVPTGIPEVNQLIAELILGKESSTIKDKKQITVQTLSGTGSLALAANFIKKYLDCPFVYISDPTWNVHIKIFEAAENQVKRYKFFSREKLDITFEDLKADLENAPFHSAIVIQPVAHNPTGRNMSDDQWTRLIQIIKDRKLLTIFDCCFTGFASGDIEEDSKPIRRFDQEGLEFFICHSFAKNFGLYNERIGALTIVSQNLEAIPRIEQAVFNIILGNYSSPPMHGALLVGIILWNIELRELWKSELKEMFVHIRDIRTKFFELIKAKSIKGNWDHITSDLGLFSYTPLTNEVAKTLKSKYHIYISSDGRISFAELLEHQIPYVVSCIQKETNLE